MHAHPTRSRNLLLGLTVLALAALPAAAEDRWLHVRVEERGAEDLVSVNIPLGLVEALLPTIDTRGLHHGRLDLDFGELEDFDLREVVEALRDAPDADYVRVQSRNEKVRVAKEGGFLMVHVDGDRDERVRVRLPIQVLDAMLGSGPDVLDLAAGLRALADFDGGDLVTVESRNESVRVWIDSSQSGD